MKTNNGTRATFSRRMVVILLTAVMALSFTACGNGETGKNAEVTTTQVTTVKGEEKRPTEVPQDVNPGQWHEDSSSVAETTTTTTTTVTTTEPTTTTTSSEAPKQEYYEYDVAGVKIKLRTRIEDYISQDDRGNWEINLKSMAESLGYHYEGQHPDEPELQIGFYLESGICVTLAKAKDLDYTRILLCTSSSTVSKVDFARYDSNDESIKTYWITNGGSDAWYRLNYEQIIIYAFLLENGSSSPYEDWMENTGIPTKNGSQHIYYVNM